MRTCLTLTLTLALATSSVARAGWSREQRATLDAIIKLENAATNLKDAGKLATVVERYEQEFARATSRTATGGPSPSVARPRRWRCSSEPTTRATCAPPSICSGSTRPIS
jgi:hypothetical protein